MRRGKVHLCVLMALALATQPVAAADAPYEWPEASDNRITFQGELIDDGEEHEHTATLSLTVEEAVTYGLDRNLDLEMLANQLLLANVTYTNASNIADDLDDAEDALEAAETSLASSEDDLEEAEEALETAWTYIDAGISPVDYEVNDYLTLSVGDDIEEAVTEVVEEAIDGLATTITGYYSDAISALGLSGDALAGAEAALDSGVAPFTYTFGDYSFDEGEDIGDKCEWYIIYILSEGSYTDKDDYIEATAEAIIEGIEDELEDSELALAEAEVAIEEASYTIDINWGIYEASLSDAVRETEDLLGYGSNVDLDADEVGSLMVQVADANLSMTDYAQDIYRNQVAMLIRNDYYMALYLEEVLEAKAKAMERGETQYKMVSLSYENGMKAKDDYLMAKMYYDSTVMAYSLAEAAYNNALYELKKDMNLDLDEILNLTSSLDAEVTDEDLEEALTWGVLNRYEIQKCLAELTLSEINEEIIEDAVSSSEAYMETEAELLVDQAEVNLEKHKAIVQSEILQSWELMTAAADMVEVSETLVAEAEEVAAIAKLKYEQGYGTETALLSSLGLESSSGTILELIAAEEYLTEIEAQVAYINYSYIMARCKFQNDAGMLYD